MEEREINYYRDCCNIQRKGEKDFCNLCGGGQLEIKVWTPQLANGAVHAIEAAMMDDARNGL